MQELVKKTPTKPTSNSQPDYAIVVNQSSDAETLLEILAKGGTLAKRLYISNLLLFLANMYYTTPILFFFFTV